MDIQKLVVDVFGTAITYIASGVVWFTLAAGLYQIARAGIRRIGHAMPAAYSSKPGKVTQHV